MMRKGWAAIRLLLRFVRAVLVSGWQTIRIILASGHPARSPAQPGFARIGFAPMSEAGAALLGAMVSLTPGTTTLDIDMETRVLILHLLDTSAGEAVLAGIRAEFEPLLCVLFAPGETA